MSAFLPARTFARTRWIRAATVLLLALALFLPASVASPFVEPAGASTSHEADFFERLNGERAARGLPRLANDTAAAAVARRWSSTMAGQDRLYHNPNLAANVTAEVTSSWQRIGENVGVGYSVTSLHDAFMASSGHRANVLGDFNRVGIGVVASGSRIWVTFVFVKGPAIASAPFTPAWVAPTGSLDSVTAGVGSLRVSGWAIDPSTAAPIEVHVYVGGVGTVLKADRHRGDVGAVYPAYGSKHGFASDVRVPSKPGTYDVCAFGISAKGGSNSLLGCRRVRVERDPVGSLDLVRGAPGTVHVAGWAIDPDTTGPVDVHVYVGGVGTALRANRSRGDLAALFPAYGGNHGFAGNVQLPAANGVHDLCAYAINAGAGSNRLLGCRKVTVEHNPFGNVDSVQRTAGGIRVTGWAIDPDTAASIDVHIYAGPVPKAGTADRSRGDLARVFPAYGDRHGFDVTVPAGSAPTVVCAYGINAGHGGNRLLGCRVV